MVNLAEVKMWGDTVGAVYWDESTGYASFEYDPKFLEKGYNISPIKMPLDEAIKVNKIFSFPELNSDTFYGLPGMLADSLPDRFGTMLLNRWLAEQGREIDTINPVERLCYTGTRGMGALEYWPPHRKFESKAKTIAIDRLVRLASEVLSERDRVHVKMDSLDKDDLLDIIKVGTSAGGARAKAVIAYNKTTGDIRSGQIDNLKDYEYWIIKLDGVTNKQLGDPKGYGKIEYAYYLMAKDSGINMTECDLKWENNRAHFMTRRFDRIDGEKIHLQSLCGLAHYDYNMLGAYAYEQAFQVCRILALPYTDSEELYRRTCFNVVARNQDDHTKNISFLMDKTAVWRLSPAYDVTYAYNPDRIWTRSHQMSINGKIDRIDRDDLIQLAKNMNIKKANNIINEIVGVVSNWPEYAKITGVDSSKATAIHNVLEINL